MTPSTLPASVPATKPAAALKRFPWHDNAIALLRSASPADFGSVPIYILAESDVPESVVVRTANYAAYTQLHLDQYLRPVLEAAGEYQGPGFATTIKDDREWEELQFYGTVFHEAGHFLTYQPSIRDVYAASCDYLRESVPNLNPMTALCGGPLPGIPLPDARSRWTAHELPFIRATLHLWRRLKAGCQVDLLDYLFAAGAYYGLSSICSYALALREELELSSPFESIREILNEPPPSLALELWKSDVEHGPNCYFPPQHPLT